MINPLNSHLPDTTQRISTQEDKGSLMDYPVQTADIEKQITQIIVTSRDSQTLLARMARVLAERFQVDCCLIVAVDNLAVPTQMAVWCGDHYPSLLPGYQAQLWQHPLLNIDSSAEKTLAIPDLITSDYWSTVKSYSQLLPTRAVLRIQTWFQSRINGIIILGRSQPHDWTSREQDLLSSVTPSVAIAISQVQLTHQVLAANRHQTLLHQLSQAMRSHLPVEQLFQIAIASTAEALQVTHALLLLFQEHQPHHSSTYLPDTQIIVASEWLEETAHHLVKASPLLNQSFFLSQSTLCQQALRNAPELMAIADLRNHPTVNHKTANLSILEQILLPALIIIPLIAPPSQDNLPARVLGFLLFQHRQPRSWQNNELELATWVSTQLSTTLIHNQTLRQIQSLVAARTAQLQQSLDVQEKLYQKTRYQVNQLHQLNQIKEDFISTMNHELRTPLTAMSLAIRMLRQPKLSAQRREKYLEILEQQCNQEIELINDLLSLQQLESNSSHIQAETINLLVLIDNLARSFEEKWADKGLTLQVDAGVRALMIKTDPDSFNRILLELLTNAGKYSDPETTVSLKVTHQVENSINQIVLSLTNIGAAISPTEINHIFEKFRRGQKSTEQAVQGTGLGLALVKCLVEHLNGKIEVSSCLLENSQSAINSFTLTIPQFHQRN